MEKHLLFPTSTSIQHYNLISEIHQSIVDLQQNPPENEILTLLKDSLTFLDEKLDVFTFENVISILNKITTKNFTRFLTLIQSKSSYKVIWTSQKLMALFDKCVEFNVDFSFIRNKLFFELFDVKQMKPRYWKYFFDNEVSLPNEFVGKIEKYSNPKEALVVIENYENIPIDVIAQGLLEINDTFVYDRLLEYDFKDKISSIISDKNFWVHIFITFSSSKEKYKKTVI